MVKTVFITGASGGLGLAVCKAFHGKGWNVFGTSTTKEGLEKLKKACPKSEGRVCDVRSEENVNKAVEQAVKAFSGIDVLVNNAGIKAKGRVEESSTEEFKKVMETNLTGAYLLTKKIVPIMKKQKSGRIINISSTLGLATAENFSVYGASKHALTGFSKSIMRELLDDNVLVSTVYPGGIQTPMHEGPRPDYLKPEEVAETIIFIAERPDNVLISDLVVVPKTEKRIP